MLLPALARAKEAARRVSCASNLRQLGLTMKMYSGEHGGVYPPVQLAVGEYCDEPNIGVLMFNGPGMYPEYLSDAKVLVCSSGSNAKQEYANGRWNRPDGPGGSRAEGSTNPCLLDQLSYFYTGWLIRSDWIMEFGTMDVSESFYIAFLEIMTSGDPSKLDSNWSFTDDFDNNQDVRRLKEGLERFMIKDINNPSKSNISQSSVPIMFDRVDMDPSGFNHLPGGANVLYMDGHVEFIKYPNKYPVSRSWAELVDLLGV